ncbi:MAG: hypothetical protein ABIH92_00270 [Nanoarchaeota archaeon]
MDCKRAQTAIELVLITISVLFFIVALSASFQQKIALKTIEKRNFVMQEIALAAQNELNIAAKSSDGYRREFDLPPKIINLDYSIDLVDRFIYISTTDGKHAMGLPAQNATGNFVIGTNIIRKENGIIFLN